MNNYSKKSLTSPKKKVHFKISRKNIILFFIFISITFLILSSVFLVYSYRVPVNRNVVKTVRYAELIISSDIKFVVKPALIYDYDTIIDGTKAYYNLVKEAIIRISLNNKVYRLSDIGSPRKVSISFDNSAYIKTNEWSKDIVVNNSIINNDPNQFMIELRLNIVNISKLVSRINNEINKMIYEYKIIITPTLSVIVTYENGFVKKYTINPLILVSINRNANIITVNIDDTQRNYIEKKSFVKENFLNPIRISVAEARLYSLISIGFLAPLALGLTFYYLHNYGLKKKKRSLLEKYNKYIIRGKIKALGDKPVINIQDLNILIRLAKMYKKPIIHDKKNGLLYIVMADTIYTYEIKNKE